MTTVHRSSSTPCSSLISVVCIVAVGYLGNMTSDKFSSVNDSFDPAAASAEVTTPPTTVFHDDDD